MSEPITPEAVIDKMIDVINTKGWQNEGLYTNGAGAVCIYGAFDEALKVFGVLANDPAIWIDDNPWVIADLKLITHVRNNFNVSPVWYNDQIAQSKEEIIATLNAAKGVDVSG